MSAETSIQSQAAAQTPPVLKNGGAQQGSARNSLAGIGQKYGALCGLIVLLLFNVFFSRNFLTLQTLYINLTQVANVVIVAVGMTLVIATGGIDLSVGSVMAIAGALAPVIFLGKVRPFDACFENAPALTMALSIVLPLLICALLGYVNGLLVTSFKIQPIVATLVLFIAGRGIADAVTGGKLQDFSDYKAFQYLGQGRLLGLPFQFYLMLAIVLGAYWVIRYTVFGRHILIVGGNETAARLAGVPAFSVKRRIYVVCAVLAGIAGMVNIAQSASADPNKVGLYMELDAIAAIAVGGTRLTGGQASIGGTLAGAALLQLIQSTLVSWNVAKPWAMLINAIIILTAVLVQRRKKA